MKRSKNYRRIWEKHNKACILPGMHVHHIDGDKTNDSPENLMVCTPKEHWKLHKEMGDRIINDKFILKANNRLGRKRTDEEKLKISQSKSGICTTPQTNELKLKKAKNMGAKPFNVFKNETYIGTFINMSGFCKDFNLNRRNVINTLKKYPNRTVNGYSFSYASETK